MDFIPSIIKEGLDELSARTLNLSENLKREELNMLQESKALEPFFEAGLTEEQVAKRLGMSRGWVQVRYMVLKMPDPIQQEVAAGLLTAANIRKVYSLPTDEQKFDFVKEVKKHKLTGKKREVNIAKVAKLGNRKEPRKPGEIQDLIEVLVDLFGTSMASLALAWSIGHYDDAEIYFRIWKEAQNRGKTWDIPEVIKQTGKKRLIELGYPIQ
jgi:hypothetical protein